MFKLFDEKINGFLFIIIFPFSFFMSYYGFETSYVVGIKSWEKRRILCFRRYMHTV
jgi:hypothetical protein